METRRLTLDPALAQLEAENRAAEAAAEAELESRRLALQRAEREVVAAAAAEAAEVAAAARAADQAAQAAELEGLRLSQVENGSIINM